MLTSLNKFARMSRGQRLKYKRMKLGISPTYVSAQIGVTRQTYTFWEEDKTKDIAYRLVVRLAEVFLTTPYWIETGHAGTQFYSNDAQGNLTDEVMSTSLESKHIPILGTIGESVAMDAQADLVVDFPATSKSIYAVCLPGQSAVCAANPGDALIVDKEKEVVPGEEVLIVFKNKPCELAIFGMSENDKLHCRNETGKQIYDHKALSEVSPVVAVARHSYLIKAD